MHEPAAITISGLGALSALGNTIPEHDEALLAGNAPFRRLGGLLGEDSPHAAVHAAWIRDRSLLCNRKWSPVTMAALHVAEQALAETGWNAEERSDCALIFGSSRGNAAGWLNPWPGRRPFRLMATSNTMHGEPAAAISIEHGIRGPNHVVASGCSAGLDAIGLAMLLLNAGLADRALVVAVDLPLVPQLLDNYAASGLLSSAKSLDPYHHNTSGFLPGEGAGAMALEKRKPKTGEVSLLHYASNSDARDVLAIPEDGGNTAQLITNSPILPQSIRWICPHATGTRVQREADPAWLSASFENTIPPLVLLKPVIGHTIGASGMLESIILSRIFITGTIPTGNSELWMPENLTALSDQSPATGPIVKVAHSMGGHNAILIMDFAG